jgi:predicted ATPase
MITKLRFQNFKALKDTELKLGMFNVLVGPNGSGKSSVLQALELMSQPAWLVPKEAVSAGQPPESIRIEATRRIGETEECLRFQDYPNLGPALGRVQEDGTVDLSRPASDSLGRFQNGIRVFRLNTATISSPVSANEIRELRPDGANLAGALTSLRDKDEEAYNSLRTEFQRWLPEFDSLAFENDDKGRRHLRLRQKATRTPIPASQVSEGSLLALTLLTIVHQPASPVLIGLEEPDRGLHPRLLRELRDTLYRLSFPADFDIQRPPIQLIVTTHSPLFLDLFKDHPEQIIIAEKRADGTAYFKNLSEDRELLGLIGEASLGEIWYSGILGGIPAAA